MEGNTRMCPRLIWPVLTCVCVADSAAADDSVSETQVIGFGKDGKTVVLRSSVRVFDGSETIEIIVYDINNASITATYPIVKAKIDRPRRSARWKEVETELLAQGYQLDPNYPTGNSTRDGEITFAFDTEKEVDGGLTSHLIAKRREKAIRVLPQLGTIVSANQQLHFRGPYLTPNQGAVFVIVDTCCGFTVRAIDLSTVRAKLGD